MALQKNTVTSGISILKYSEFSANIILFVSMVIHKNLSIICQESAGEVSFSNRLNILVLVRAEEKSVPRSCHGNCS
jgi:hypothetical protein